MIAAAQPAESPAQAAPGPEPRRDGVARALVRARNVSVPLVAISTPDPAATIDTAMETLGPDVPMLVWDGANGLVARNDTGAAARACAIDSALDPTIGNPLNLLKAAQRLPDKSVVWVHMATRWTTTAPVVQALWNLRDQFKLNRRMLVLLAPVIDLPPELAGDVVVLDDPLPDPAALEVIVREVFRAAELPADDAVAAAAVHAVQGLSAFQAEQAVAMSLRPGGVDMDALWTHKHRQIALTPGLKVVRGGTRFRDIGGVEQIKGFLGRVLAGRDRPGAVVWLDEIEKHLAGSSGAGADSSGVSQDQLGTILSFMQDEDAAGALFVGPPGSAKSMVAKATGNEGGIPTIQLDLGGVKGSLVGESERQLRAALKVINSVSNGRSLWLATSNSLANLPPELRRRFGLGIYFFDLPSEEERQNIWSIWLAKLGLALDGAELPADDGWTGAEIQHCCEIAYRLGCPLAEAAAYVVPVSRSAPEQLAQLRQTADGRFLSASRPGLYRLPGAAEAASRGRLITPSHN